MSTKISSNPKSKIIIIILASVCVLLSSALIYVITANYDYLVFKYLMSYNYSDTDSMKTLYGEQVDVQIENEHELFTYFDNMVIDVVTDKIKTINQDRYTYLYTPTQYQLKNEFQKDAANESEIKEINDDSIYLKLTNISVYTKDFVYTNVETLKKYKNIIIDLRDNPGGELNELYKIAELFLDKGDIIGKEITRSKIFSKTAISKNNKTLAYENIYLLQDSNTASAAEGLINALRENLDHVKVIGTSSFGKGIGQITIPLKKGFAIKATVLRIETPNGNCIQGVGIIPDIEYDGEDIMGFVGAYLNE